MKLCLPHKLLDLFFALANFGSGVSAFRNNEVRYFELLIVPIGSDLQIGKVVDASCVQITILFVNNVLEVLFLALSEQDVVFLNLPVGFT